MKDSIAIGLMVAIRSLESRVAVLENTRAEKRASKHGPPPAQSDKAVIRKIPPSTLFAGAFVYQRIADLIRRMTEGMGRHAVSITDLSRQWEKEGGKPGTFKSYIRSKRFGFGEKWFAVGYGLYTAAKPVGKK